MGDLKRWQKLALWAADNFPKNKLSQDLAYKIISDPQVGYQAGATTKDVARNVFSSKPKEEDTNKYMFVYGADTRRPETTIGQAYDWSEDIRENGYENVKTYSGVLNPYNEYLVDSRNKGLVEEFAKVGYSPVSNINNEYVDWNTYRRKQEVPYYDDVHGYRPTFHFNNGKPVISSSDLYDFGKNYNRDFADLYVERSGSEKDPAFTMELQRRALNSVGQPYLLVQKNIPIRFVNNPQGNEIWRTNNFNKELRLDEMSDREISDILHTGYIEPAVVTAYKKGGRIHIKKKNRGKFTESAKRAGMGVQEYARHVLANKDKYSSTLVKRAAFAKGIGGSQIKKHKHENGGILKAQEGTGNLLTTPHPLSPIGVAVNQAKAMAKTKGEQQPQQPQQNLPPGVKEVVGSDGQKIVLRSEQPLVPLEQSIAEWLPGTGDVAEVGYIADDVKNGNYGSAALAAGLMFLPGNVNKLISKSRIDPIFINGKINQAGIQEGLFGGKRSAESFMGSQTYKDAVAHDIALAKRAFGYDINPVVDDRYIKMPVKVEGASLGPHDAGLIRPNPNTNNPADDRILVDVGKHKTVNDLAATVFHENLHHGRFKTIDPQGNTIFTEIYHPEKVNPTLDFYRWKLKHLFKPEVEIPQELLDHYKYLTSVEIPHNEGATNVLELGFLGNTRAKSGYPGAQEVQKILDEVRKANPQHAYTIDLLNMKKPKRVWEAMTGQYEDGGKLTDDDYRERVKKFLLWRTVGPEESTYIKNFKM